MKREFKIEDIIRSYKNHPDELSSMIEEKKIGIDNKRIKRGKN